jgi:hypothetical protein
MAGRPVVGRRGFKKSSGAIRQMLLQAPAPVVAKMLGYHPAHAEALAAEAGGTWKHYAPGDHTQ